MYNLTGTGLSLLPLYGSGALNVKVKKNSSKKGKLNQVYYLGLKFNNHNDNISNWRPLHSTMKAFNILLVTLQISFKALHVSLETLHVSLETLHFLSETLHFLSETLHISLKTRPCISSWSPQYLDGDSPCLIGDPFHISM